MIKLFGIIIEVIPSKVNEEPRTPSVDDETTIAERGAGSPTTLSGISTDDPAETSSANKESSLSNDTSSSDEKLVPCPRCSSIDTKFCYYNNYNVSQPRHVCKMCQRYWTAGGRGTMRIVPVGSARRKNKSSPTSQYCPINHLQAVQAAPTAAAYGNGCLLAFGTDPPQCESVASAISYGAQVIGDDKSSGSLSTDLNHNQAVLNTAVVSKLTNIQESPRQVACFPVPAWASPWNTAEWMSATEPAVNFPQCSDSQTLGKHSRGESMTWSSEAEKVELEEKSLKRQVFTPTTLRIYDPTEAAAESRKRLTLGIN